MTGEDTLVGQTLVEKYRVVRQIGRGGMGVVYEAEHIELGKRVAIKLMLEKYAADHEAATRFKREALAASRIGNPHIIDVADIGFAPDGRMFVVMELLHGESLADALKRGGAMAPARALKIMRQTLRAVGAAHAKHIVHRDLKPDNIFLVGEEDFVKLLDFGISKVIGQSAETAATNLTSTGAVIGTPLYMAPEQAMGEAVDHRADIYALGVILYELLAGRPPFEGPTYAALVMRLLTTDAPLLTSVRSDLPAPVVAAVHRALEKEPGQRFDSCDAFAAALAGTAPSERAVAAPGLEQTMHSGEQAVLTPGQLARAQIAPTVDTIPPPSGRRSSLAMLVGIGGGALVAAGVVLVVLLTRDTSSAVKQPISLAAVVPADAAVAPPVDAQVAVDAADLPDAAVLPAAAVPTPPKGRAGTGGKPTTLDDVQAAVKKRDGKACRSALARLASPPPTDIRVASAHAVCEMLSGRCEEGVKEMRAVYQRQGSPPDAADTTSDLYCPPGNDPPTRLRRISKQLAMFTYFDCDDYLEPTRAAAAAAANDRERLVVGSLLSRVAVCFSHREDCTKARAVLAEAQVFIPALALDELNAACR